MNPNLARMNTIGMDTIAGSKLLQVRFGLSGVFQSDQAVMHGDRRARFIRMCDGAAIIRYWGESRSVAVPPETLSLPPPKQRQPAQRAPVGTDAREAVASTNRSRLGVRAKVERLPRHHPQRRPLLRP
jgi:hypothetical protein